MNWKNVAFWIMIFVIIFLSIYIMVALKTESYRCIVDSGVYFVKGIDKANNGNTTCNCFVVSEDGFAGFTLDKNGLHFNSGVT